MRSNGNGGLSSAIPRLMARCVGIGALLLAASISQAASFVCEKASTPVEKMICREDSLSKLDDRLASVYQQVLGVAKNKEAVRVEQKRWLNETRDTCRDAQCLKEVYSARINALSAPPAAVKRYPPYPDVWGYSGVRDVSFLCSAADGDFYILPSEYYKDVPKTKFVGFFSGATIHLPANEAEAVVRGERTVEGLGQLKCGEFYSYAKSLTLSNGYSVKRICVGNSCQYPFGIGVEVRDGAGHILARKVLLQRKEKEERIRIPRPAAEGGGFFVSGNVLPLDPHFIPLEDNTFLVFAGSVHRFDTRLQTKRANNEDHLFVVGADLIEDIYRKASVKLSADDPAWAQLVEDMTAELVNKIHQERHQ